MNTQPEYGNTQKQELSSYPPQGIIERVESPTEGKPAERRKMRQKRDFPWKLHIMLEDAGKERNQHIVSWHPDGMSFKVYKPKVFVEKIMPRYFNQTQFRSFQRMVSHEFPWVQDPTEISSKECAHVVFFLVEPLQFCKGYLWAD
jgi:hypothetical protein